MTPISYRPVSLIFGLVFLVCVGGTANTAYGQDLQLPEQSYVNEFARPGQPTMTLYLWGSVGTTGIWRVERDVDLIQLLSVAQVPGIGASQQNVRQNFILHIYREIDGERTQIYEEEIQNLIGGGARSVPSLQDGDILAVETQTRQRISLNLIFTTLRTVSSFLSLYLLLRREF
jgi:hypothetical protein